jgi:acyl dehydratase
MPESTAAIGKRYPADLYAVGREKIREFASATGETEPLYLDLELARAAGHPDLVAPPMFVVVYQGRAITPAITDPELAIDFDHLLHGAQEFRWETLVHAGDEITSVASVASVSERAGLSFYVFEAQSVNQRGETVATGTWTNIVRPPAEGP